MIFDDINFRACVYCVTFNQARFIKDTLEGFAIQTTDFPFVCCVFDDCSNDGEQQVISDYINSQFDNNIFEQQETEYARIIFARHKTNENCFFAVYLLKYNHYSTHKSKLHYCLNLLNRCEYMAYCEGDDYWTNPEKLQKQVKILDSNPKYGFVYAKARKYKEAENEYAGTWGSEEDSRYLLFNTSFIPTLSIFYRTSLYNDYLSVRSQEPQWVLGDVPLYLYFYKYSKVYFWDEVVGVYRELSESASHSQNLERRISFYNNAYKCRAYYAEKYFDKETARQVHCKRINQVASDCIASDCTQIDLIGDLISENIYNPSLWFKCIVSRFYLSRKTYRIISSILKK